MTGDTPFHEFLITADGELNSLAEQLPMIREYIAELPQTASTFTLSDIDGLTAKHLFEDIHLEFVKSWPIPDNMLSDERARKYVNPNASGTQVYSDISVYCECGALVNQNYDAGDSKHANEHDHTDDCLPHHRLAARAATHENRYEMMKRLSALGWKGSEIAPRLGIAPNDIGGYAKSYQLQLRDLYDVYRQRAGATYAYLVRQHGVRGQRVADIYGHNQSSLSKWASNQDLYEPDRVLIQEDGTGLYEWHDPEELANDED